MVVNQKEEMEISKTHYEKGRFGEFDTRRDIGKYGVTYLTSLGERMAEVESLLKSQILLAQEFAFGRKWSKVVSSFYLGEDGWSRGFQPCDGTFLSALRDRVGVVSIPV